jgi:stage III sporulation protein AH
MKNKKVGRYLLLAGLVVVLIGVGYLNYALGTAPEDNVAAQAGDVKDSEIEGAMSADDLAVMSSDNYFKDYKANRESVRDKEMTYLDSIIADENSDAETIKDAQDHKIEIVQQMENELTIEGLLMASGFDDAIVTVQSGSVNVVIKAQEITKEEAAKILEIVRQETGESAQNIKVMLQS